MCHCSNTGVERTPNKSQHTKLTLEKKILSPLLPGFELATFRSRVRCSNQQAIPAPTNSLQRKTKTDGERDRQTHTHTKKDAEKGAEKDIVRDGGERTVLMGRRRSQVISTLVPTKTNSKVGMCFDWTTLLSSRLPCRETPGGPVTRECR